MYLSRIEVFGFKSFPQKLVLELGSGITSVVGPNGCGKSNISDSVRWALGEHNVRQLRGKLLEDLIFNGSERRDPLGMAEVSLTFSGAAEEMGLEMDEFSITRRIFRSGESEFLLNGTPCRLKEITNKFLDRGLGHRGYAIIEREMVDRVLEETSRERRALLEEAAGIARYKNREKAARRKLELTDIDLRRLEDIVGEVDRRVDSLRRQLGRARRYQELEGELREVESRRLKKEYTNFIEKERSFSEERQKLEHRRETLMAELSTAEARRETLRLEREEADSRLARAEQQLSQTSREATELDGKIRVLRERERALREKGARAEQEVSVYAARRDELLRRWQEGTAERELLEAKTSEAAGAKEEARRELEEREEEFSRLASDLEERRTASLAALERRVSHSKELQATRRELAGLESQERELGQQLKELDAERERHEKEVKEREGNLKQLAETMARAEEQRTATRRRLEELDRAKIQWEEREREVATELSGIESSLALLRELQERLEGFSQSVREVLREARAGTAVAAGVHGVVGELLTSGEVKASRALEAALSQSLECVVTDDMTSARRLVSYLRDGRHGRATFLPIARLNGNGNGNGGGNGRGDKDSSRHRCPTEVLAEPGVVGEAMSFISCNERLRPVARFLLGRTVVTESMETAERLAEAPRYAGLRFVTLDGQALTAPGVLTGGSAPEGEGSPFDRGRRIGEMERRYDKVKTKVEEAARARLGAVNELYDLKRHLEGLEREMEELRGTEQEERGELRRLEGVLTGAAARRKLLEEDRRRNTEELGRTRQLVTELESQHQELERAGDEAVNELAEVETELRRMGATRDEARARLHQIEIDLTGYESRLKALSQELPRLISEREESERGEEREKDMMGETSREAEGVGAEIVDLEESLHAMAGELEERQRTRDGAQTKAQELATDEKKVEQEVNRARSEGHTTSESVHRLELSENEMRVEAENLRRRVLEEHQFDLAKCPPQPGESVPGENTDEEEAAGLEVLRARAHELQEKIRRLGAVNFVALEEYDTEKDRLDFLTAQRDDLLRARNSLEEAIQEINLTARDRFSETFDQVRANFQNTFQLLFDGGEADIYLPSGSDPLDCPIEIVARPRGKSLREVSLLSGGERALTAIALLVALYQVKPSPFCIMDEVDAPLDDANVLRFTSMLEKLKERTQFIVVTHNKRTMEAANTLFGVTMDEPGVTNVVSVRLEEAVRWAEESKSAEEVVELN